MSRPPLARLAAVHDDDPRRLDEAERRLRGGAYTRVWRPAPGWVAAAAPLPRSEPDGERLRAAGMAFAEGRDVVLAPERPLERLLDLVDRRPERLAELPGDFGFVRFRPGGATVARSAGGLVPFYRWQDGSRIVLATRLTDLVPLVPSDLEPDPLIHGIWLRGYPWSPGGRTFFRDVAELRRGRFVVLSGERAAREAPYWDPRRERIARPTPAVETEHAERLRALLLGTLERELDPDSGNLIGLSGGVDSSSLTVLAGRTLGRPVWTVSFVPMPGALLERELSYINPVLLHAGVRRVWHISPEVGRRDYGRDLPPLAFHVQHPVLLALSDIVREAEVRVLFGGEFGDDVAGSWYTLPDWAAATPPWRFIFEIGRLPEGPRDLVRWARRRMLRAIRRPTYPFPADLPDWVRPSVQAEYRDVLADRRRAAGRDRSPRAYLALSTEQDGFVGLNWEVCSAFGVRRSFPFFTREMLELAFSLHPAELVGPGYKKVLRRALADDVPARNLDRPDKGPWAHGLPQPLLPWTDPLPDIAAPLVRTDWFPRPPARLAWQEWVRIASLARFAGSVARLRSGSFGSNRTRGGVLDGFDRGR